ncbi:MAG: hypothetical protein AABW73_00545 [Nanoarchaeota archaeon]
MLSSDEQSWFFLREFTREILVNINSNKFREEIRREIKGRLKEVIKNKDYILKEINERINPQDLPKVKFATVTPQTENKTITTPLTNKKFYQEEKIDLGKVSEVIGGDVYVVECQGPEKPLVIKKPGGEETTAVTLSEDEIKRVIADFANLAKTYPTEGVFNAAYKNYSITAVLSDLAGSRFIITKYLDIKKLISAS